MKKIYFLPFLFLMIGLLSPSCKNDDDNSKNSFSLDGANYSLSKGYIEDFGANGNGTFDFDINLTSSEINLSANPTGTGSLVYLDLNTNSATGLVAGTYNYSDERDEFSMVDGTVAADLNVATNAGSFFSITAGSVTVAIDGTQTTLDFTVTLSNGKTVTGNYKGILQPI